MRKVRPALLKGFDQEFLPQDQLQFDALLDPIRRYQIQRVWRGENPQVKRGRFREFYQCDIDIIGRETLSYLYEAEIPSVIYAMFKEMAIGEFRIRINNRKLLKGILQHFEVPE